MDEPREPKVWWALALVALVALAWGVNWHIGMRTGQLARGINGDMFGAINALFTGLAFAAVIFAIMVQRYEVHLLKKELSRTKEIMNKQSEGLARQNEESQKKSFEDTFLNYCRYTLIYSTR